LRAMWEAIRFDSGAIRGPDTAAIEGRPQVFTDKNGNYELTLPPGWKVKDGPPAGADASLRMHVVREAADGTPLIHLHVVRKLATRAEVFSVETAGDRLQAMRRGFRPLRPTGHRPELASGRPRKGGRIRIPQRHDGRGQAGP
jgi:hypothetical protein